MTADNSATDEQFVQSLTNCQRELRAFIGGLTPTRADADDVLQEVNLALWKKRNSYDPRQEFIRWAFGFVAVELRSFRSRSANSRLWFSDEVVAVMEADWPFDLHVSEQRRKALEACLGKLDARQREMITAFYSKRVNTQELAAKYGKSVSALYKAISRLRESLRGCVNRTLSQAQQPPHDVFV